MNETGAAVVERLAADLPPAHNRPSAPVNALVFDGLRVLASYELSPPTIARLAHWCELAPRQVDRALKRLIASGDATRAGCVSLPGSRRPVQSYAAHVVGGPLTAPLDVTHGARGAAR